MMARRQILLWFAGMVTVALIAFAPMRWILPDDPFSARKVSGTIWSARLEGTSIQGLPLGDLDAGLAWPGRLKFSDGTRITGSLGLQDRGYSVRDLSGTLSLAPANPAAEDVEFRGVNFDFGPAGCKGASGRIRLRLAASIAGLPMGQTLVGGARCTGQALGARLSSQSGLEVLTISAQPDGKVVTELLIRPGERDAGPALLAAGFKQVPLGYKMVLVD
jgi:Type II secretion system (T2SS), protein N